MRLLREPLLHFLAIGGLLFLLFAVVAEPTPEPTQTIVVGPERIQRLATGFEAVWRRPPTDDELRGIVDDFVREEIYYRQALELGLDRDDAVVRRRLRQKMEFMTDTGADLIEPTAGELETYFAANEKSYQRPPRLAFEQIYLGETPNPESAKRLLNALQSDPASDPSGMGERTLLPAQLSLSRPDAIDAVFGKGFFERTSGLPGGLWAGPVTSAYGLHLVRILDSQPGQTPPLDAVRDAVRRDWKAAKTSEIRARHFALLRERYVIEIDDAETPTAENR